LHSPIIVLISIEDIYAEDISNQNGTITCLTTCTFEVGTNISAENFSFEIDNILIQPTFGNEVRKLKFELEDIDTPDFMATFTIINEQIIIIDVIPDQSNAKLKFNIDGSQLVAVEIDGVNRTLTFNPVGSGETEVEFTDEPFGIMKIFLPQNADTRFATFGRTLEGDFLNNFTNIEFARIHGIAENYNLSNENIRKIIDLTTIDGQKAYEIAGKMFIPIDFTPEANLTKVGQAYIDGIGNSTSFAEIFDKIEQRMRNETVTEEGNVPNAGKNPNPT